MILSVGEILTDMIGKDDTYEMHVGGAPFNVAVAIVRSGGECAFVGKVGNDVSGNFIKNEIKKYGLLDNIITDEEHNTTMSFVSIREGERSFSFVRKQTADYRLKIEEVLYLDSANIVNMGTLMLSEEIGRNFADELISRIKAKGILLAMDANFRDDLFESREEKNRIMLPYLLKADILKLSKDELFDITNQDDITVAVEKLCFEGILFVTDGEKGSYAFTKEKNCYAPSKYVVPVDTTGAGDAYFGTVLAEIEKIIVEQANISDSLLGIITKANEYASQAVTHFGAV